MDLAQAHPGGRSAIPLLAEIEGTPVRDARGSFLRLFGSNEHGSHWRDRKIAQVNHASTTDRGTVRGMHFQLPPASEAKVVRCIRGRVFDVGVDLRPDSPTFLEWFGIELSPERANGLFIPEGCAHGYQSLEPGSELVYVHSAVYDPQHESGVLWNDPLISIAWPLPVSTLSPRDGRHELLRTKPAAGERFSHFAGMLG